MKKVLFFLFFLLPFLSFSQCAQWIGGPLDSAMALKEIAQKFLQFPLPKTGDTTNKERYSFQDEKEFSLVRIRLDKKNTLEGTDVKTTYGPVKSIYISGPAERIEKLLTEYFYPLIKPCETKSSPTWIMWNGLILVHRKDGEKQGIPMASVSIEKN